MVHMAAGATSNCPDFSGTCCPLSVLHVLSDTLSPRLCTAGKCCLRDVASLRGWPFCALLGTLNWLNLECKVDFFLFFSFNTEDWTLGLAHAWQILYLWTTFQLRSGSNIMKGRTGLLKWLYLETCWRDMLDLHFQLFNSFFAHVGSNPYRVFFVCFVTPPILPCWG